MSAREAAERLGTDRESARRALAAGLAGPGVRTRSAVLYDADRIEQLEAASRWFRRSPWTRMLIRHRARSRRFVPFVATLGGFVVLGADIVDVEVDDRLGAALTLTGPGAWFADRRGGRFDRGRGSRWQWWDPREECGWSRPPL